ncbi:hypothetical protein ILYODFUR_001441 [Ilyodon furcidens]|uniref:Uncharacterized protein n=1 Tax=Ilyodon furcidens TaxID=33524 RepID=A0ABV0VAR3_9TELE
MMFFLPFDLDNVFFVLITAVPGSNDFSCFCERTNPTELHPSACSIVYLRKQEKNPSLMSCRILTSTSGLWQAAYCWGLIGRASRRTQQCYQDLYCSLISSLGFPQTSSLHPLVLFSLQPSIILPLSEGPAKLSGA